MKIKLLIFFSFFKLFSSDEARPSYITSQIQDTATLITESYRANDNKIDSALLEFIVEKVKDEKQFKCIMDLLDSDLADQRIYNAIKMHRGVQKAYEKLSLSNKKIAKKLEKLDIKLELSKDDDVEEDYSGFKIFDESLLPGPAISTNSYDKDKPSKPSEPKPAPAPTPAPKPAPSVKPAPVVKTLSLNDQLIDAVKNKNGAKVRSLISQGANAQLSINGKPIIMLAIENGCADCAKTLYPKNKDNKTAYSIGKTRRTITGWMKAKKLL